MTDRCTPRALRGGRRTASPAVTINRPERLGAYTPRMCAEILDALRTVRLDDDDPRPGADRHGSRLLHGRRRLTRRRVRRRRSTTRSAGRANCGRTRTRSSPRCTSSTSRSSAPSTASRSTAALRSRCHATSASSRRAHGSAIPVPASGLLPDEGGAWLFPRTMGYDKAFRMVALSEIYDAADRPGTGTGHRSGRRRRSRDAHARDRARARSGRPVGAAGGQVDDAPGDGVHAGFVAGRRTAGRALGRAQRGCARRARPRSWPSDRRSSPGSSWQGHCSL